MPSFDQNQSTNLKLKSASRLETARSEILNGSSAHVQTLFNESFLWFVVTDTPHFASFPWELGHKLKIEKCTPV